MINWIINELINFLATSDDDIALFEFSFHIIFFLSLGVLFAGEVEGFLSLFGNLCHPINDVGSVDHGVLPVLFDFVLSDFCDDLSLSAKVEDFGVEEIIFLGD
tara:strand:+ start:3650 stop:3958 length:309 start_codon:yes stop_codon:yes gene_type:complete